MKVCKRGHEYRGDENYRARQGWCPVCNREAQSRYDRSERGRARYVSYNHSDKGEDRSARYRQSPAGWLNALNNRRARALKRRKQPEEAEDSYGPLPREVTGGPALEPHQAPADPRARHAVEGLARGGA